MEMKRRKRNRLIMRKAKAKTKMHPDGKREREEKKDYLTGLLPFVFVGHSYTHEACILFTKLRLAFQSQTARDVFVHSAG